MTIPRQQIVKSKIPKLRFLEFGGEWEEKKLSEVSESPTYGMNAAAKKYDGKNIYLRITDIDDKTGLLRKDGLTSPNGILEEVYRLKQGDLLFTRTGASTGKTYLYKNFDGNLYFAGFLIKFSISNADPYFIYLLTLQQRYIKWVKSVSMRSGQPGINAKEYSAFKINLPTLPEQQKIASFLSTLDNWLDNLREQKRQLEKYKKGIMQKIFSQEICFKDDNGEDFPNWDEKRLGDFLIHQSREVQKPDSAYKAIGIRSHFKGTFQRLDSDPDKIAMDKLFEVKANDFILNITFAWEGALAIAKKEDDNGLVSHRFPTYVFNKKISSPEYFRFVFPTKKMKYILENISPGGAGRNRVLNKNDFLGLTINLPSLPEQQKIVDLFTSIDDLIEAKQNQITQAAEWKKGLMQQMFI